MTKIVYERPENESRDCTIEIHGTGQDVALAVVQIIVTMSRRMGLDANRFFAVLPAHYAAEVESTDKTVCVELPHLHRKGDGEA